MKYLGGGGIAELAKINIIEIENICNEIFKLEMDNISSNLINKQTKKESSNFFLIKGAFQNIFPLVNASSLHTTCFFKYMFNFITYLLDTLFFT